MKKRKPSNALIVVVDPGTRLTQWSAIGHEGWAVVDIHVAADADEETLDEVETGRLILDRMGVPLIAVTVDQDGIDAEHLRDCIRWWGVRSRIGVWVPEWDVEETEARLAAAGIEATVTGIPAPLDDVIGAPDGPMAEVAAQLSGDRPTGDVVVFLAASAIISTHNTNAPSIVEEVVVHCAGGWTKLGDSGRALADWRERVGRLTGAPDVRLGIIVGDGSEGDRKVVPKLEGALRSPFRGHIQMHDEWRPTEVAHALVWAMTEHLSWGPRKVVLVLREDAHFEDELRRAWAGIDGAASDLHVVRADPYVGLIERNVIDAVGAKDAAEELAVLEAWDARGAGEPL